MKSPILLLFAFIILAAAPFAIDIRSIEEKETSVVGENHFNISIFYDCERMIKFSIKSDGTPVRGAKVFVFYEERYTSLLGAGETDSEGGYTYTIIGNPANMRNLFLVTVEKSGFRTKEAHFVLPAPEDCLKGDTAAENAAGEASGDGFTGAQQNESMQEEEKEVGQMPEEKANNSMQSDTAKENKTVNAGEAEKEDEKGNAPGGTVCDLAFFIALFSFFIFIVRRHSSRT